ncbi:type I-E CRISPR-associated protein Cse2/CasB [Pseudonocardia oroxyli]|uniref:type I-E CRISPR-associated protein Cse2/CasB n=1 Tax=Pseudonocardia oroxyli TaxID=366584 RepID=UPI0015A03CD7|nr:type I-E CRISPR-associated protein Cse2/CasB [Pseudonocardia oroxyli]
MFVDERVSALQSSYLNISYRDPAAVAALARLRRGVGKRPGELLDLLEFTTVPWFVDGDAAGDEEWAVHVALTLFSVHQQSRGERMHQRGRGLGQALRSLHSGDQKSLPDPLMRRFRMLGTADDFTEFTHHLRGVVQLLRTGGAPLDYGVLTDQLVDWQRGHRSRVQLTWGRQFHRTRRTAEPVDASRKD